MTERVRQQERFGKELLRVLKLVGLMVGAAVVIPITMISMGLLLGPKGYEGLLATPLAVLVAWGLILFFGLKGRATVKKVRRARSAELPGQVARLLERQRRQLPAAALPVVDALLEQLEQLAPYAVGIRPDHPSQPRLRRLLADDLAVLIENYQRLPIQMRDKPLHGGPSPKEQVTSGLRTIDAELRRLTEELLQEDLTRLATKQRYLELKYGDSKADDS